MAKGQIAKDGVKEKILSTFDGAFIASDGKTIRIPMVENGEVVEVKITLTAAKDIEGGAVGSPNSTASAWTPADVSEPTAEEMDAVNKLASKLGLL